MECTRCSDIDLELVDFVEIEKGFFDALFKCRQCGHNFSQVIPEYQLNYWLCVDGYM